MNDDKNRKLLFIFDFDYTIINKNTDGEIINLNQQVEGCVTNKVPLPANAGWSEEMSFNLQELYEKGVSKSKIDQVILNIPLTEGFIDVFDSLRKHAGSYDCVILSHSNRYFIDLLLSKFDMRTIFANIYTYDCEWMKDNSQLFVKPYDETSYNCEICPSDFCKGECVKAHLKSVKERRNSVLYDSVVYIGDGSADYCAALQLKQNDIVLVREGFSLQRHIEDGSKNNSLKSKWILWKSGTEIANLLNNLIECDDISLFLKKL